MPGGRTASRRSGSGAMTRRVVTRTAWRVASLAVLLGLWELAGRTVDTLLLPTASATVGALWHLAGTREFWSALWISHQAVVIGFPAAAVLAIPAGLALGRWTALDRWLDVHLSMLLVTPKSAIMPLIVMALGLGLMARSVTVFAFAFPVMVATTRAGLRDIDGRLLEMARAFGATELHVWRRILLPGTLPAVATAVRLGLAQAIAGLVAVELLLVAVGLGHLILTFQADFDAASVYAVVCVVAAEAALLIRVATLAERRIGAWRGDAVHT